MDYMNRSGIYFGFADISISELAEHYFTFFDSFSLLVTCLDSQPDVASLDKWISHLKNINLEFSVLPDGVWLPAASVPSLLLDRFTFRGFDEAYLLRKEPRFPLGDKQVFTTDRCKLDKSIPERLLGSFHNLEAIRYVSDGSGMNFMCESLAVVEHIREIERRILAG